MSTTPRWLSELIWDTALYAVDCLGVLGLPVLLDARSGFIPVALVSGVEHELDYYTDPLWTIDEMFAELHKKWDQAPDPFGLFDRIRNESKGIRWTS